MLDRSRALRASKGCFGISEYFLPFSPSLTRRGYLSLLKACQILLREVSDLIDGAGLVCRPSYSLFRAIILLPSLPWQMEDGLLALSYVFKPSVLSATFHAPKTSRTDALHPESSMRWRYEWGKRVPEDTEGLFWSGLLSSLEISFEVRSWGWMNPWPQGIRRACVKSLIWLYPSLHLVSPFNFLPAWPSLYTNHRMSRTEGWGGCCMWAQLKSLCGIWAEVCLSLSMQFTNFSSDDKSIYLERNIKCMTFYVLVYFRKWINE